MPPSATLKPDFPAVDRLITEVLNPLAQADEWHEDSGTPLQARSYLQRHLTLIRSGRHYAPEVDYMPIEIMQLLIHRSSQLSLWTQDFDKPEVVWLTSMSEVIHPHTMAFALQSMEGQHIAYSSQHFFQLGLDPQDVRKLVTMALTFAQDFLPHLHPPLPMEVEPGALVVHREGTSWAIALSQQHRQCLRRDCRTWLDDTLVSVHCLIPDQMWSSIAGDGYCGYAALWRVLCPASPPFLKANPSHRMALRAFLDQLVPQIPADLHKAHGRLTEAIMYLDGPDMPPLSA
jgi:hypothetical protein